MTQTDYYYLPDKAAQKLLKGGVDKLNAIISGDDTRQEFRLLDTFDTELCRSGRLLFETGDRLDLETTSMGRHSQPVSRQYRFVDDLADGPVKLALQDVSKLRALLPIGGGERQETSVAFVDAEQKTRVRAHLSYLTSDQGGCIALVLLRGLRGYDKALEQVRRHILALGGRRVGDGDIYVPLFPQRPQYDAKPDIDIGRDEAAHEAANDIISTYLPIARANEPGIIADHDIEFLHDYRVALRKIRSVLSLFAGVYVEKTTIELKERFSGLMSHTGQLRDLDVYLAEKEKFFRLLPKSLHSGLEPLFTSFEQQRKKEHETLKTYLESKEYKQEIDELTKIFSSRKKPKRGPKADLAALEYSRELIWKRYRKVCKIAAGIDDQTDDAEVHRLRIQCKKLRYLMEFFGPVFPGKQFLGVLRPLKKLQDNLGLFNDYSVQQDNLRALLDDLDRGPETEHLEIAQSVGALIVVLHGKQMEERNKVVESFKRFNDKTTRKTFRELFHVKKGTS